MLKSLDVVIGLTVVLLALSMAVTVITQAITTVINSRGRHLRRGLTDLLQQLDPALNEKLSKAVATEILTHPLVSGSGAPFTALGRLIGGPRLGNVVHREEFTKLLMAAAAGQTREQLSPAALAALTEALANNGVADPKETLKKIRTMAMQLERSAPEISNVARQNMAILHAAETDLVAKINNWFDQTMDRTSQRFTASTRLVTFAGAFLVAFGLQVDTPALVNRFSADDALREAFVEEAQALYRDHKELQQAEQQGRALPTPTSSDEVGPQVQGVPRDEWRDHAAEHGRLAGRFRQHQPLRDVDHGAPSQPRRAVLVRGARQAPPAALGPCRQGRRATPGAAGERAAAKDTPANRLRRQGRRPRPALRSPGGFGPTGGDRLEN